MTNLRDSDLREMHLERATLVAAHLERADLRGAHLEGTDLSMAYLEGADLTGAIGDAKPRLPDGIARPADWPPYAP